jgi:hypothetical protein
MGQGIILMVPVTSIQKLDTGFSGGILNFESCMVSQLDTEKKYKFQTLYIIYIASFHIKKGVRNYVYMIIWRFRYAVAMKKAKKGATRDYNDCTQP